jgi:ABC-2 type transport system ATP-binding protein
MIAADGLTKAYGSVRAVDDLTFTVQPGAVTGFLGGNGAGKSTTLRMLLGLDSPTSGRITVGGRRYHSAREVGSLLDARLHPRRTARDHLRWMAAAIGVGESRVDEVLRVVEVPDRRGRELSLGMRQRVGLAGALLGDPSVLVLDEPLNGLDPAGIRWMRDLLRAFAAEGRTVFLSSHLMAEMEQTAERVVVIAGGRLVAEVDVAELRSRAASVRVAPVEPARLPALGAALERAGGVPTAEGRGADPVALLVSGLSPDEVGRVAFAAGIAVRELSVQEHRLEESFLQLTGGAR